MDESYNCFEHFDVETGRGAGWHQFGGLSSAVLNFYGAYFVPGRLTVGLDTWVTELETGSKGRSIRARVRFAGSEKSRVLLMATLAPARGYSVSWNGRPVGARRRVGGCLEILLPSRGDGVLTASCTG